MNYGQVEGLGKPVSRLVQGTAALLGKDEARDFAVLDAALERGVTAFDTAHQYGDGANERFIGRWLRSRGVRERVVLIGKGAHHNRDRRRVTPFDITADLFDSLARFDVEHIDLYLLHRDDERVPVGPIVEVLNEHHAAGRIRAFGGSNWSHLRIREANAYARVHGLAPFAASSPHYSLAEQLAPPWEGCVSIGGVSGEDARAFYRREKLALFAWSSLAGGFFSGRFRRDNLASFSSYEDRLCVTSYASEANFQRLERAERLAEARGVSIAQIALAYVLNQPLNLFALVGAQSPQEVAQNAAAAELELSADELAWLNLETSQLPA